MGIFKRLATAAIACAALCACNEPSFELPDSLQVYQQYEVYINEGQAPAAFANLRDGSALGGRVEVKDGALTCNNLMMYFSKSQTETTPEFNYSRSLDATNKYAEFRLKRSSKTTLKNRIDFADVPMLKCPDIRRIENGVSYPLDCSQVPEEYDIYVALSPSQISLSNKVIYAELDRVGGKFTFFGVLTGTYQLRVDVIKTQPTTQNDRSALGEMRVIRRSAQSDVQVPIQVAE